MSKKIKDSIIIEAELVFETDKSLFLNCEGDEVFFPKSKVNFNQELNELELPVWLAREKFPDEQF